VLQNNNNVRTLFLILTVTLCYLYRLIIRQINAELMMIILKNCA